MDIEFLSTVAVSAPDPLASRKLYVDALRLPLESKGGEYHHSEQLAGCKSFGIWLATCPGGKGMLRDAAVAGGAAGAAGQHRVRRRGRRGGGSGGTGARASRLRATAPTAGVAVGSNGRQAAVTGRRDRRDLVRPCAARPRLTGASDHQVPPIHRAALRLAAELIDSRQRPKCDRPWRQATVDSRPAAPASGTARASPRWR